MVSILISSTIISLLPLVYEKEYVHILCFSVCSQKSFLGDHIFGLCPLLASCMNGAGGTAEGTEDSRMQTKSTCLPVSFIFYENHVFDTIDR